MKRLVLLALLATLAGCATSADVPTVLSQPVDSAVVHQAHDQHLAALLQNGRLKFKGPVVIQLGGAGNTASATAVGKAKAPVAAAPHAVATDTRPAAGGPPWWLWPVVGVLAFAGGFVVRGRLRVPGLP